jgi:hypothetical protein
VAIAFMSTLAAGLIGTFCWRTWWSIGFAFAVPIFVGLPSAARVGARGRSSLLRGVVMALGPCLLSVCRQNDHIGCLYVDSRRRSCCNAADSGMDSERHRCRLENADALATGVLPPLGLIGWASPVASAGVLFPGTAWLALSRSSSRLG